MGPNAVGLARPWASPDYSRTAEGTRRAHAEAHDRADKQWGASRPAVVIGVVVGAMSVIAIGRLPYLYYSILRWVVTSGAVYFLVKYCLRKMTRGYIAALPFALLTIVFNPILPCHMRRGTWLWFDLFACALFFISAAYFFVRSIADRQRAGAAEGQKER